MNILYVTHRVPYPPNKGDKIRAFHHIRELAKEHRVHLACAIDAGDDAAGPRALARYCASVETVHEPRTVVRLRAAWALASGRSHSALAHASRRLGATVARTIRAERIDALVVYSIAAAECVRHVGVPKALDFVDVVSEACRLAAVHRAPPASWLLRLEARRLARYETEVSRSFDCAIFSSDAEARAFEKRGLGIRTTVIGNGVDLDYFAADGERRCTGDPPHIVMTGAMDYFPNIDAATYFWRAILPRVRAALPVVRFSIVGRDPGRAVRTLAREPGVIVTGTVPDVRPYLASAAVAVAPMRIARGIQNKVLEALAMGVPVVATSAALAGLPVGADDGVRRADEPSAFARAIVTLVLDRSARERCARQARRYVERWHRWEAHGVRLRDVLQTMVTRSQA